MVTISLAELTELRICEEIMHQVTYGMSGRIQNQSSLTYGFPPSPTTYWMPVDYASDLDIVRWGRICANDACLPPHPGNPIRWLSPLGQTSLYGVIMVELCRRLEWYAYRDERGIIDAVCPTGSLTP